VFPMTLPDLLRMSMFLSVVVMFPSLSFWVVLLEFVVVVLSLSSEVDFEAVGEDEDRDGVGFAWGCQWGSWGVVLS